MTSSVSGDKGVWVECVEDVAGDVGADEEGEEGKEDDGTVVGVV